ASTRIGTMSPRGKGSDDRAPPLSGLSSYRAGRASIEKLPLTALDEAVRKLLHRQRAASVPLDANLPEPFMLFHEPAYVLTPAPCRQSVPDVMLLSSLARL